MGALHGGGASAVAAREAAREGIAMLRRDEKRHGRLADAAADLMEEGGSKRAGQKGSAHNPATVKSTSLGNLVDAVKTFRAGR